MRTTAIIAALAVTACHPAKREWVVAQGPAPLSVSSARALPNTPAPSSEQSLPPSTSNKAPNVSPSDHALSLTTAALQKHVLAKSHAYELAKALTIDVGPRLAGSKADALAVAWALRTMQSLGLANVHSEKVMVTHWERGIETASITSPTSLALHVTALGRSKASPPQGIEAEVVEVTSMQELEQADPAKLRAKIVFINVPTRRAVDGSGYGETTKLRYRGPNMAKDRGAKAVLFRSAGPDTNRLPHTGITALAPDGIPSAAISVPDAEILHELIARNTPVRVKLTLRPRMYPKAQSANVVGEVVGSQAPNEIVLIGAHLDSWDLGTGAVDDAAGVGIVLDVARILSQPEYRPKRTVRTVLFANEENGSEGSDAYALEHRDEMDRHVVALEADLGADRAYGVRFLGAPDKLDRFHALAAMLAPLGIAAESKDAYGGVDIADLRAYGVPFLQLEQDLSRYFDWHHSANDTIDKIDKDQIAQVTAAVATLAWAVASMDDTLGRIPENKRQIK